MVEDERSPGPTGTWEVKDTDRMEYAVTEFNDRIPPGLVIKLLREDPERGDWTWLAADAPNRVTPVREIHSTIEECFLIRGDCLLGEHGEMSPGSYFWRPGMVEHGPMSTRSAVYFFRTKEGGLDLRVVEAPGWEQSVAEHRGRQPFFWGERPS